MTAAAFQRRRSKDGTLEESVSVNWLEYLAQSNRTAEIQAVREVLGRKMKLGSTSLIAVLNVGEVRRFVSANTGGRTALEIRHDPDPEQRDESHSGIYGVPEDDLMVPTLIAEKVLEVHPARP